MTIRFSLFALIFMCSSALLALEPSQYQAEINRLYAEYSDRHSVPEIDAEELVLLRNYVLVDVRTDAERQVSMLPGAIDVKTYETMSNEERQNAVIYCTIGVRSGDYVAQLAEQGISTSNLAGGLLSWAHAGGLLLRGDTVVEHAHVYGRRWRLLPERYQVEWFWWVF